MSHVEEKDCDHRWDRRGFCGVCGRTRHLCEIRWRIRQWGWRARRLAQRTSAQVWRPFFEWRYRRRRAAGVDWFDAAWGVESKKEKLAYKEAHAREWWAQWKAEHGDN